jgi:hypothetical protein
MQGAENDYPWIPFDAGFQHLLNPKSLARADARNPTGNGTGLEGAAMLARGVRADSVSVASARLTALLRSRLGFFGHVGFLDPFQLRGNYPPGGIESEPRT